MMNSMQLRPNKTHFDDMLLIKTRLGSVNLGPATVSPGSVSSLTTVERSTGYSALARYERAGLIKSVSPLSSNQSSKRAPAEPIAGLGPLASSIAAESIMAPNMDATKDADPLVGVSIVQVDESADLAALQNELSHDDNFEIVSRVPIRYLQVPTTSSTRNSGSTFTGIPPTSGNLWNLDRIRAEEARKLPMFSDAGSVKVAVLDSGIQEDHPDITNRVANYVWNFPDLNVQSGPEDIIGHGTHVAGTIMANFKNEFGIKGICNCDLHAYKIFDDTPDFFPFPVPHFTYFVNPLLYRRALAECLINGMNVVNLSIGGPGQPDPIERQLFSALMQNNTTVVAAMGNEFQEGNPISYPAAIPGVIAVGATNISDSKASFSNTGNHIALCAPGTGIWSTLPTYPGHTVRRAIDAGNGDFVPGSPVPRETRYAAWDGTSMATPHVTAAVALLLSNSGGFSSREVKEKLQETSRKLDDMNGKDFTSFHGSGCLELESLLKSVLTS